MLAGVGVWVSGGFDYLSASGAYDVRGGSRSWDTYRHANKEFGVARAPGGGGLASNSATPEYTIRKNVPEVRLQFTVADEHGRLIPDLSHSDLRILDDHVPVITSSNSKRSATCRCVSGCFWT